MPKTKSLKITSPTGVARWPRLNTPDTKFSDAGEYKVDLVLNPAESGVLGYIDQIQQYIDHAYEECCAAEGSKKLKRADSPIRNDVDEDGNATGLVVVRFKMKAVVTPKSGEPFSQRPKLFNAAGHLCDDTVGGGSKIRVNGEVVPFYTKLIGAGVTIRLKAVQIVDLVEPGGDASAYGFEMIEDDAVEVTADASAGSEDMEDY